MRFLPGSDEDALWSRLQAWQIDNPDAALPFSARLAADNGWDLAFAQRAIREYKRFAFLATTSDALVTPSDAVDQVWHLHLAYTRSYWEDFCPNVLRQPLHHQPTRGGPAEDQRYRDTYAATLARYEAVFGHAPPADLWPAPEMRFGERFQRVKVERPSLLQRLRALLARWRGTPGGWLIAVGTLPLISSCAGVFTPSMVNRPEAADFLNAYLALCLLAIGIAAWLRLLLQSQPTSLPMPRPDSLTTVELAWLARGHDGVVQTVIAQLFATGQLTISPDRRFSLRTELEPTAGRLERAFVADLRENRLPAGGGTAMRTAIESLRLVLEDKGLVPSTESWLRVRGLTTLLLGGVLAIGFARVGFGIVNLHPVGILLTMMVVFALIGMLFYRRPKVNALGRLVVRSARVSLGRERVYRADARMAQVVALLGTSYLAATALADVRGSMERVALVRANDSSGGDGGGCGGGGCGGGGCGV